MQAPPEETPGARALVAVAALIAVGAAILPVVVATVRALAGGWVPLNDDAYFGIRAFDVFTANVPLVGTWTSASLTVGRAINNPGPLYYDLLAVPVRVFGTSSGVAVGVALVNVAAIVGIAWVAHRRGGVRLLVPAMLVTTLLAWTMGSDLLYEPWQPHAMLLPFLCFLFLVWGVADGGLALLPWTVGVGSLLVQTHLGYAFLVPGLLFAALVGTLLARRARQQRGEIASDASRRRLGLVLGISLAVGVVCWVQPLVDQVAGFGNLGHLAEVSGGGGAETLGAARGVRALATVLSLPPFFFRPSFTEAFAPAGTATGGPGGVGFASLPSLAVAVASLGALVTLLAGSAFLAQRRRDRTAVAAVAVASVGVLLAWFTSARVPIQVFGASQHNFRSLWPLAAFVLFALLAPIVRAVHTASGRAVIAVGLALTVVMSVLTLPTYHVDLGPTAVRWAEPIQRDVDAQMAEHLAADPPRGALLTDFSNIVFLEPYSTPLMAQLQRSGVDFVTAEDGQVHQIGRRRRYNGHNAVARFVYRSGDQALRVPPGEERIALHRGLDRRRRGELERLRAADVRSPRRERLERRWNDETIGVFVIPLDHRADAG